MYFSRLKQVQNYMISSETGRKSNSIKAKNFWGKKIINCRLPNFKILPTSLSIVEIKAKPPFSLTKCKSK